VLYVGQRVLGHPVEAQFGPLRTFVMGGFDHHNHTILVGVRRARRYYSNYKTEFTFAAPLAAYKKVHKYTDMNFPLIGMCVKRRCPVPDKSACCQSIRPVRASLSTIRPEASVSRRDRAATLRTLDSTNARLRPRCRAGVIGPN
jgi:hypothetical protein